MDSQADAAYTFRPLSWHDALTVARWRYPPPYAAYDMGLASMLPLWLAQLLPRPLGLECYTVWSSRHGLTGIFTFNVRTRTVVLGLAMRPDLTGQGRGRAFVEAGMRFARAQYAPRRFLLDVARGNQRARRVYEQLGFVRGRSFTRFTGRGPVEYIEMSRDA